MKTTKLVIGIVSIVLSALILLQSCAAGAINAIEDNGEISGSTGLIVALTMLIAGIIAISTRKNIDSKAGIVAGAFYIFGGVLAIPSAGTFSDLKIWGIVCIGFGLTFIIGDKLASKK